MNTVESLARDYHAAFMGHLLHRSERSLERGWEIGRRAVGDGVNLLELARIHHEVFGLILAETRPGETEDVVSAASEFFLEVLATYHMTRPSAPA